MINKTVEQTYIVCWELLLIVSTIITLIVDADMTTMAICWAVFHYLTKRI